MTIEKVPFDFGGIVIYIRTSTDEQNPENQLRDCESVRPKDAKTNIFVDYHLIEDKNSAWKDDHKRVGFNTIISLIKSRRMKTLIVWDLDRIYRNRKRLLAFFELCKVNRVSIYSFRQNWLNELKDMPDPWNDMMYSFMLQIMGWIAEEESTKKSDRVKSAIRMRVDGVYSRNGKKWGRKRVSTFKRNRIAVLLGEKKSMREIGKEVNLSVGAVHKYVCMIKGNNLV